MHACGPLQAWDAQACLLSCVAQKYLPLDLRPKKTRAIRRQMTKHEVRRGGTMRARCLPARPAT